VVEEDVSMTTLDQTLASIISPGASRGFQTTADNQKISSAVYYTSQEPISNQQLQSIEATVVGSSNVEEREINYAGDKNHRASTQGAYA
jgi:hypothetical protein